MLDNKGFDLWADGYDRSVGLSDEENTYPFAGYKDVLGGIFEIIMQKPHATVLEMIIPKLIQFNDCKRAVA